MSDLTLGSLFSGIGGLELGLERALGCDVAWQVEQNQYCRDVLERHWPSAERFNDVKNVGKNELAPVDIMCGGFPCQDVSSAGNRAGLTASRSGLWYEYLRIVGEVKPAWVVVENVASGARLWVDECRDGLGSLGYQTLPVPVSARDVGAPHERKRIFIIAYAASERRQAWGPQRHAMLARASGIRKGDAGRDAGRSVWLQRPPEPVLRGVADGVPARVARLTALGNAVVPQCSEVIGHMIVEMMGS